MGRAPVGSEGAGGAAAGAGAWLEAVTYKDLLHRDLF